jgi:hypothetical protein
MGKLEFVVIIMGLVLAWLLYRELTRKNNVSIENMSSDSFMEMTPNGVKFTQPVTFASTVTGDNMTMANIKTNQIEKASSDKIIIKNNLDINGTTNFTNTATFVQDVNANSNLYVGTGTNKWHLRDTRLGLTGKFDFVPGFTSGSTVNDNWIRLLNYDSKDAGNYFDVGLAVKNIWSTNNNLQNNCITYGPSNRYRFCLQSDGNVVQYNGGGAVWATNRYG